MSIYGFFPSFNKKNILTIEPFLPPKFKFNINHSIRSPDNAIDDPGDLILRTLPDSRIRTEKPGTEKREESAYLTAMQTSTI